MIHAISHGTPGFLSEIQGGDKHNAIPREAWATVLIPEDQSGEFLLQLGQLFEDLKDEYRVVEPDMDLKIEEVPLPSQVWSTDSIPHPSNCIPLAKLAADAVRRIT